jgi:hypothetical protein
LLERPEKKRKERARGVERIAQREVTNVKNYSKKN